MKRHCMIFLGCLQVRKVGEAVQRSVERGQPWQILMSQTIFARVNAPKLQETVGKQKPWLRKLVCAKGWLCIPITILCFPVLHLSRSR